MQGPFLVHSATKARVIRCVRTYNIALIATMLRIERGFIEPVRLQVRRESDLPAGQILFTPWNTAEEGETSYPKKGAQRVSACQIV